MKPPGRIAGRISRAAQALSDGIVDTNTSITCFAEAPFSDLQQPGMGRKDSQRGSEGYAVITSLGGAGLELAIETIQPSTPRIIVSESRFAMA